MDKKTQDLAWACLPKEAREEVRTLWELDTLPVRPDYDPDSVAEGAAYILTELFGHHNLTSATEPSKCICVNKEKFENFYKLLEHCYNHDSTLYDDLYWKFVECAR